MSGSRKSRTTTSSLHWSTRRISRKHKLSATPTWRRELTFQYYDDDGRLEVVADWGTSTPGFTVQEDPANWGSEAYPAKPSASDSNKLVTKYAYDDMGRTTSVTDPKATVTTSSYDDLSRVTQVVEDEDGGRINRTTSYSYDTLDGSTYYDQITADNGAEADQLTKYYYGDVMDAARVSKVIYPDTGEVTMTYNEDGTLATRIDQRKWKTTYTHDGQARATQETVTAEQGADPAAVQGTLNVRYTYDALGRLTVVEDDNGQTTSPDPDYDYSKVEYTYTWSTTNQVAEEKHTFAGKGPWTVESTIDDVGVRTSLKYPHASGESYRTLSFTADDLQRLTAITEGGDTIADYDYKGLYLQERGIGDSGGNGDRIVKLTLKDSSDLDGYDEWGRIKWMRHYKVSGAADRAKYAYAYDYGSNRNYQEDLVNATTDELYAYDTLHRLTSFERGDLNVAKDDITDTPGPRAGPKTGK